jgi:2-C-methyl-D-erythritol 4-phosphate cytidylyltransferase
LPKSFQFDHSTSLVAIVPAAGIGKRMQSHCPKQYLTLLNKTVLEHTVEKLLSHEKINQVIIALSSDDDYFANTSLINNSQVSTVTGGKERVDSVLAALKMITEPENTWALVHDAARPCLQLADIDKLIEHCQCHQYGALLATPVRDTMKRAKKHSNIVAYTESREHLWHALTPQIFPATLLINAIESAINRTINITDESSAIEAFEEKSALISGGGDNIKITHPEDLALAEFILLKQQQQEK